MSKKLYLLDGTAIFYRAYFALIRNPLINSKGENTSAVFGFLNTLMKILLDEQPDAVAIVFDTGHPTFRHDLYKDYKATREKMPDDLRNQLPRIHQLSQVLNIPLLELPGYEADDIIGTLSVQGEKEGYEVYLVSGDKDFMQLITDNVKMYQLGKNGKQAEILSYEAVEEKFGCHPSKVIDVLGLMGDTSDNVPGVEGVGPKTAIKLIAEYGSMEGLYENIDKLKASKNKEKLIEQKERAFLSKRLVTIDINTPIEANIRDLLPKQPDMKSVREILEDLEFSTFLAKIENYIDQSGFDGKAAKPKKSKETVEKRYKMVTSHVLFNELISGINKYDAAFDTETTSVNSLDCNLVGMSFSFNLNEGYYIPCNHDFYKQNKSNILYVLKKYFEDPNKRKIGHNIKFDALVLSQYDINVKGIYFDTMIANYLLLPGARHHKLDDIALKYLDYHMVPIDDLIGSGKNQITMDLVDINKVSYYAAEDAEITFALYQILKEKLEKEDLWNLFTEIEMPLVETLLEIEKNGISLDIDFLTKMSDELANAIETTQKKVFEMAEEEFNLNSPKQLGPILFDKLEIHKHLGKRGPKKTKTGSYSTAENELEKFKDHKIVDEILNYRELTKLKSTYVDALPKIVNRKTGKIHTSFNQTIAATGRLSSTDPNLQNIPIRTKLGREIRKAFVPSDENHVILSADYSQIELRIVAAISNDTQMKAAFKHNHDIHTATAATIFNVDMNNVNSDMRRKAKEINFGVIYGISQWGLASRLGIPDDEAKAFIDQYFIQYPGVHNLMMQTIAEAKKTLQVKTIKGRKRQVPEINSDNRMIREGAERVAINTPIQGSAADLIKLAMITIQNEIEKNNLKSRMILQVHDELVFDVIKDELETIKPIIKQCMEHAIEMDVPLDVEIGVGANWLEAH
jgi:DNA polymerase I